MEKIFEDQLFEAKICWDKGDHSDDNLWANWKYEQAEKIQDPCCGTFEYWDSVNSRPAPTMITRKVRWAEMVIANANMAIANEKNRKRNGVIVSDYVRSDGTYVRSHIRG